MQLPVWAVATAQLPNRRRGKLPAWSVSIVVWACLCFIPDSVVPCQGLGASGASAAGALCFVCAPYICDMMYAMEAAAYGWLHQQGVSLCMPISG
jgi:hypothetical protein